jgi:hypothetical protein
MVIKTRKPTGRVPWPLILLEGGEKAGKSWAAAELSASAKVGRTLWIDLGEGSGDEYGAIPGTRYELIVHDGTWKTILGQVEEIRDEARKAAEAGEPPLVLVIDGMTLIWEMLKDWAAARARLAPANKKLLEKDPNAEINISANFWNDANTRHRRLMTLLMTFPGIVIVTARGKEVTAMTNGQPDPRKPKDYRVEAHKDLGFDATVWVRMFRTEATQIIGARSVHAGVVPGEDKPVRKPGLTLEELIFDILRCDPGTAHVRDLTALKPGSDGLDGEAAQPDGPDPELAKHLADDITAATDKDGLAKVWRALGAADAAGQLPTGAADQLKAAWNDRRDQLLPLAEDDVRMKRMFVLLHKAEIVDRDERLAWYSQIVGRDISSTKELTGVDVVRITERTEAYIAQEQQAGVSA